MSHSKSRTLVAAAWLALVAIELIHIIRLHQHNCGERAAPATRPSPPQPRPALSCLDLLASSTASPATHGRMLALRKNKHIAPHGRDAEHRAVGSNVLVFVPPAEPEEPDARHPRVHNGRLSRWAA